ncbi:MAG: serine hydrolase [Rubrivivax sp.]
MTGAPVRRTRRAWRVAAAAVLLGAAAALVVPVPWWMVLQGRARISDHRHFDNAPIARSTQPSVLVRAPAPLRWPGGMDAAAVEADLEAQGTVALLVAREGRLVYERYFDGHGADTLATSFSMAKSVVSVLLGIAIDEGRIAGVDEPVTRWLPELGAGDAGFERITLRHLLAMRSGIAFDEGYRSPFSDAARFYVGSDLRDAVARLTVAQPPDQRFHYSSGDTQLLAMALERAVGMPLARWAETRLWQPLGAEHDASWSLDSARSGVARGFCCLNARAVDYLRFGLMVAEGGQWNGRRIVSRAWLERSTAAQQGLPGPADAAWRNIERPHSPQAAFYAWQWRRRPLSDVHPLQPGPWVYAQGLHGQILLIDPETRSVALRLGRRNGDRHWPAWLEELLRLNR